MDSIDKPFMIDEKACLTGRVDVPDLAGRPAPVHPGLDLIWDDRAEPDRVSDMARKHIYNDRVTR